jgi:hypothetical protein
MLSPAELLNAWERSLNRSLTEKAVSLAAAVCPDSTWKDVAALSIGQRDRILFKLRETLFGANLSIVTTCSECQETLESNLTVSDLLEEGLAVAEPSWVVECEGYRVTFRLPCSADLSSLPPAEPAANSRNRLLALCILEARDPGGEAVNAEVLPAGVVVELTAAMAKADPQAEIMLNLTCPACQQSWKAMFDITSFLWKEINAWAQRVVRDVHELARAYGWREADVLALSPTRRQLYLELTRQ